MPEVLLKVVEAKKLLDSERVGTVQEAAESRPGSAEAPFYKYKDDIFPFMKRPRERRSPLSFRWMMSRDFYL